MLDDFSTIDHNKDTDDPNAVLPDRSESTPPPLATATEFVVVDTTT